MKKGIHFLFGVKDGVADFPAVIDRFATLGFDCVELPPEPFLEGDAAKHIVSYAAERGVEIVFSCGFTAEHDMASDDPEVRQNGARYMERVLSVMDGAGIHLLCGTCQTKWPTLRTTPLSAEEKRGITARTAEVFAKAVSTIGDRGIEIAIEPLNRFEGFLINTAAEGVAFCEMLDNDNAVTRPLHAIPNVEIAVADAPLFDREEMVRQFAQALETPADAVICTHVSNVFGCRLPVERIAALCRERGVPFVLDASQSAGTLPVDMAALGAAFIAMPGHKGLYGPQGTGLLLCGMEPEPLLRGGTGSQSLLQVMPDQLPDRLEPGTHNMPGIAGLLEGLRFVKARGTERIAAHERRLTRQLAARLAGMPGVEVFFCPDDDSQTAVLSFRAEGWDCEELGEALAARGAAVRAGLHCAPLAHRTAGTLDTGTVRCSFSAFNTAAQVEEFARLLGQTLR